MRRHSCKATLLCVFAAAWCGAAELSTDQRQVAVGYERLETLALRIADAVETDDPARADQIRTAIGEARAAGIGQRFDAVVRLLERERFTAARRDQTQLATQLEELLRLVMADPNAARLEEERQRLEQLRKEIRAALREQRALRARAARGESAELADRQQELADRIERLREPAEATDRLSGKAVDDSASDPASDPAAGDAESGESGEPSDAQAERRGSIAKRIESGGQAMRRAEEKLREDDPAAAEDQLEAQRELEAAQREAEERLKQLREEEQERRLASLADRLRRMREAQTGVLSDTKKRTEQRGDATGPPTRAIELAAAKLAVRESGVAAAAEQALRVVRADGSSLVFDDALSLAIDDLRSAEERLRETRLDATTIALETSALEALVEMIAAVDQSLDELQKPKPSEGSAGGQSGGDPGLVSKIAELRMIRSIQARLLRQTTVWGAAVESGEASRAEVAERLARLADEQRRLAAAVAAVAGGRP